MCGISGFLVGNSASMSRAVELVKDLNNSMELRGPDGSGIWEGEGVVLGHRRLAIQDLHSRAAQPMSSNCSRYVIIFNGEIYNFHELRCELLEKGVELRTFSDTEVILQLYIADEDNFLDRLRGMFAIAIWDVVKKQLFLARDPYGIKPLYYSRTQKGFCFASQVKAIENSSFLECSEVEPAGIVGFYLTGSVPEPWTTCKGVYAVPAGHSMKVSFDGIMSNIRWFDMESQWHRNSSGLSDASLMECVSVGIRDSVQSHLVSDVPVCLFLSAGVDSGAIAGLASELNSPIDGITIGFSEFDGDERNEIPVASEIAEFYGAKHHSRIFSFSEFEQQLETILQAMDQPTIDGINTWFASKAANELGFKVALSGVGGDELFCGYPSFKQLPRAALLGSIASRSRLISHLSSGVFSVLSRIKSQPKYGAISNYWHSMGSLYFLRRAVFLPGELTSFLPVEIVQKGLARLEGSFLESGRRPFDDPLCELSFLESTRYMRNQLLRDADWASMGNSVELRTPFVDSKLLESLGSLTRHFGQGIGKRLLGSSPSRPLSAGVIGRNKTGFTTPMNTWVERGGFSDGSISDFRVGSGGEVWARRWATYIGSKFL